MRGGGRAFMGPCLGDRYARVALAVTWTAAMECLAPLSPTLLGVHGHSPAFPDSCGASVHRAACRGAWHPQGPHRSTRPPRATTGRGPAPPPGDGSTAWEQGGHHVVARGGGGGWRGPCGCQAWDHPTTVGERGARTSVK